MVNYYLITTAMTLFAFIVLIFIYEPRKTNYYFMILMLLMAQTNCGYLALAVSTNLREAVLANKLCYLGGCFMPPILLFLICAICNYNVRTWLRCILYGYSAFVYIMVMTSDYSDFYYKELHLEEYNGTTVLGRTYGPGHNFFYVILYGYLAIQVAVLVYSFAKKRVVSRYSLCAMLIIEVITITLFIGARTVGLDIETTPMVYAICSWVFLYLYNRSRMYNIEDNVVGSFGKQENYGYMMFNNRLKYLGCNQMALEVFPAVAQCVVDRKIGSVPGMGLVQQWLNRYIQEQEDFFVYEDKGIHYECRIETILYRRKPCGYMISLRDDTDRWKYVDLLSKHNKQLKSLTNELEQAKEEAVNANKAKTQFLARVSHEVRTPVNAILGMNEMILRESRDAEILEYATDVKNSSMALLGIINEILDSTKLESGMMELVEQDYEICHMLKDVYGMIKIRAKEKNLELVFDIDTKMPKGYWGDDKRIKQVLLNLLTNAVKYTDKGTVTLQVRCRTQGDDAFLWFSVKDTGIGIKEENINKIYDAFKRFDLQRNRNVEGTGLGMNIAKQFLTLMGSELEIKSEYGAGSEFSFEIKQRIRNHIPIGQGGENGLCAEVRCEQASSINVPDARILVVDDNLMNLKVIKSLLKKYQAQVQEAQSGADCIALLEKEKYDLVFLDHMMPQMDGVEAFRIIKERQLAPKTPIVMLTANAIEGDKEKYLDVGFDDFLSKPIIAEQLEAVLRKYL